MAIDPTLAEKIRQQLSPVPTPQIQGRFSTLSSPNGLTNILGLNNPSPSAFPNSPLLVPNAPVGGGATGGLGAVLEGATPAKPGFLSSLKGLNATKTGPLGILNKGGLAGGIARGGAGFGLSVAGSALGGALGGNENPAGRFATGAGTGAGLGMLFGPYGAVVGGLALGLGNVLFGGKSKKQEANADEVLGSALSQSGLSPEEQREIRSYYTVISKLSGDSKESKVAALNEVGQLILQKMQQKQEMATQSQFLASTQAQTAQFIEPYMNQANADADLQAQIIGQLTPSLPPEYRAVMTANAQNQQQSSRRLASALGLQGQMTPVIMAQQRQMEMLNQAASSLYGQALSGALQGPTGGMGGGGLQQILAGVGVG